ncbi:putative retrotransposon gag domain, aspartic peptidase domain protein [Tanacetum coccineum]
MQQFYRTRVFLEREEGNDRIALTCTAREGPILTPYEAEGPFLPLEEPEAASLPLVGVGLSTSQPPPYTVEGGLGSPKKLLEDLDASPWKSVELIIECLSKADLVETKGRTEDPCRDNSVTSGIRASRLKAMANEGDRNVGGESGIVVDENRCREESRQGDKRSRGASRDTIASLAKRMVGVETSMSELKERVEESHQHLEELGSYFVELREDFKSVFIILFVEKRRDLFVENLKICEPMYHFTNVSWLVGEVDFVQDLKKQFYPENAKHEAKSRLRKLKHSGTIREYVKAFTTLVLEIPDLSDQDFLFYFLDGLQGWAKTKLERRGVQDLATAIPHAEALIDLGVWRSRKPTNEDSGDEQGGGEKQVKDRDDGA